MTHEQPTYNQITDQLQRHEYINVLVPRSNDKVSVGIYKGESPDKPGYYRVDVDGGAAYKDIRPEALTDDMQAELAEYIAGKPLRQAVGACAVRNEVISGVQNPGDQHLENNRNELQGNLLLLKRRIDKAIEHAGQFDPSAQAGWIGEDIYQILTSLRDKYPEAASQLDNARAICNEISKSGIDPRSPYHRNAATGLTKVLRIVESITL